MGVTAHHRDRPNRDRMVQRDIRAMLAVLSAATAITSQAESTLRRAGSGMRGSEWDVLVTLYTFGPMRPAEIVRQAAMAANAPTVHAILGRLEGRGLINREAHPEQPRGVLVTLSEAGSEAVGSLFPILERKVINGFSGHYSEQELDHIVELMERL